MVNLLLTDRRTCAQFGRSRQAPIRRHAKMACMSARARLSPAKPAPPLLDISNLSCACEFVKYTSCPWEILWIQNVAQWYAHFDIIDAFVFVLLLFTRQFNYCHHPPPSSSPPSPLQSGRTMHAHIHPLQTFDYGSIQSHKFYPIGSPP